MATNNPTVGMIFNPSHPELINFLSHKITGMLHNSASHIIVDANVYAEPPYDLVDHHAPAPGTGDVTGRNGVWYFYCHLRYTSPSRRGKISRVVGRKGTWSYEYRRRVHGRTHAGYRTYFSYEEKRGSETVKLDWSMMQYSIHGRKDFVLCKVYKPSQGSQGLPRRARAALQRVENILMADGGVDLDLVANDDANVALQEMQSLLVSHGGEHQHHPANATVQTTAFPRHDNTVGSTDNAVPPAGPSRTVNVLGATTVLRRHIGLGHDRPSSVLFDTDSTPFNTNAAVTTVHGSTGNAMLVSSGLGHHNPFDALGEAIGASPFNADIAAATVVLGGAANTMLYPELGCDAADSDILDSRLVTSGLGHNNPFDFLGEVDGASPFNVEAAAATAVLGGAGNTLLSRGLDRDAADSGMLESMLVSSGLVHNHNNPFDALGEAVGASPFKYDFSGALPAAVPVLSEVNQVAVLGQGQYHHANDAAAAFAVSTHHLTDNMRMVNSQVSNDDVFRHLSAAMNHIAAAVRLARQPSSSASAAGGRGRPASTQRTGP